MKGVIMAGGEGTRLRPLTSCIPKPMVPVVNRPIMEHIINLLKKHSISKIAVTMCYLPNVITDYFGSGESLGVELKYYLEEVPLGTGGSVLNAEDFLTETFVVISGDALTDIDLQKAVLFHKNKGAKATLVLKREPIPLEFGIVIIDHEGKIVKFLEKPGWEEVFSDTINTGIYILEPEVLKYYKKGENFDFSKDLFPKLLEQNVPLYGYVAGEYEYWNDIGDLKAYKQTHLDILDQKVDLKIPGKEISPGIFIGDETLLPENVKLSSPVVIGNNCVLKKDVTLDAYTILGDDCVIGENTNISRGILWDKGYIGRSNDLRGTILCNHVKTEGNVQIAEDTVVGEACRIGSSSIIKPDVKIWPHKTIKKNCVVNRNLVWGTTGSKKLFGRRGITGEINFDVTPEYAALLGSAFGNLLKKQSNVVLSSDGSKSSNLIKDCISAGLLTSGLNVIDIETALTPMSRFAIRFYKAVGGVHVSQDFSKPNTMRIEMLNQNGGNIDKKLEKKVENLIITEDFKKADYIGDKIKVENFSSLYIQNNIILMKNLEQVKKANFRLLIASPSSEEISIFANYLKAMGCDLEVKYFLGFNINDYKLNISNAVKTGSFDMGVVLNGSGEEMILLDETGNSLSSEQFTLLASYVSLMSGVCQNIIVPNIATSKIESLAQKYGAVVTRTKSSTSDLINKLLNSTTPSAENLLQYQLFFDALASLGIIIGFLNENKTTINKVVTQLPQFYIKKAAMTCDIESRGRVISELIKQNMDKQLELVEGVKINTKDGWALILPDIEEPAFHIFSEGYTEEYAQELSFDISERLKELIRFSDCE